MTLINVLIHQSGTTTPLTGYIEVTTVASFSSTTSFNVTTPVRFLLVAGAVTMDLVPTDLNKTSYRFQVYQTGALGTPDILTYTVEAVVPFSLTAISFNSLVPQTGIRYDLRDSSLLTLARYLVSADSFVNFFGSKLWSNKGLWNATATYKRGDVVLRNGSSYQSVLEIANVGIAPELDPAKWFLIAMKGDPGAGGTATGIAVGSMTLHLTTSNPALQLICSGQAVSRSTYSALFAVIGAAYGVGDGSTTFNLPSSAIAGLSTFYIYTGV